MFVVERHEAYEDAFERAARVSSVDSKEEGEREGLPAYDEGDVPTYDPTIHESAPREERTERRNLGGRTPPLFPNPEPPFPHLIPIKHPALQHLLLLRIECPVLFCDLFGGFVIWIRRRQETEREAFDEARGF